VVEHLDDLEIGPPGQRQDRVAGAEARVNASTGERLTEQLREVLRGTCESTGAGGEDDVVQTQG
jgi:hypothetical protein